MHGLGGGAIALPAQPQCTGCKYLLRPCGAACSFLPYFPADDAFAETNFDRVREKYGMRHMRYMIGDLQLYSPPTPFRGNHKPVVDALRREIDECDHCPDRRRLQNQRLEFVGFLLQLYQENVDTAFRARVRASSSSGATNYGSLRQPWEDRTRQ